MQTFYLYIIYFFIYSILGWCTEMIYCRICQGKWTDRGFFYGPYCPIYGFGAIIIISFLTPFIDNILLVFLFGVILTTILEYLTSYFMEKIFDARWWDYSTLPLNINGRVCLLNSFLFGMLGLIIIYIIHPKIANLVSLIPYNFLPYITYAITFIFAIDFAATLITLFDLKSKLKDLKELGEQIHIKANESVKNMEIIKQLEEFKNDFIFKKNNLKNRLINAFPNLKMKNLQNQLEELKQAIYNYQKEKKKKSKKN